MDRVLLFLLAALPVSLAQSPRVEVSEGTLVGKTVTFTENKFINVTKQLDLFLGVPFADPPVRFQPPSPKAPWGGERDATDYAQTCSQAPGFYDTGGEDCLYLNVYAPHPKPTNAAVMVWIHGGGFSSGTAMTYTYSGIPLVAVGDVIMVSINYRLGVLSQFTTNDDEARGNMGMLDQVAALKWVYENVQAFGGDRNQITIFGESAGAASISFQLLSKLSRNYYNQAVIQSGTAFAYWAFEDLPEKRLAKATELGIAFDCDVSTSAALVECLSTKDDQELVTVGNVIYDNFYTVHPDGVFLDDTPTNIYDSGDFKRAPLIAGFNRDEGTFTFEFEFPDYHGEENPPHINRTYYEAYVRFYMDKYGVGDEILVDAVIQEYTDWTMADYPDAQYFQSCVDFSGDIDFKTPTDPVVRAHSEAGDDVFKYHMSHAPSKGFYQYREIVPEPTPWVGAGHADDLVFVFGMPFIDEFNQDPVYDLTDEEKEFSVDVMTFWTNFAKSGHPSKPSEGSPTSEGPSDWPIYTIPELRHQELRPQLAEGNALRAAQCQFWNEHIPYLAKYSDDDDLKEWKEDYMNWKDEMEEWNQVFSEYQEMEPCN